MNSLGRTIQAGERVVLKSDIMRDGYDTLEWRTVSVEGDTSGNCEFTTGTAIIVRWKDGEKGQVSGLDIDATATAELEKTS